MKDSTCCTQRIDHLLLCCYPLLMAALFFPAYTVMVRRWGSENYNYCLLVLPVLCYLLWRIRDDWRRIPRQPSLSGLYCIVPAAIVYCVGEIGGEFYTIYFSSWLLVVGLCLLLQGRHRVKLIRFHLGLALAVFPLPDLVFKNVTLQLKLVSSRLGVWMLQTLGMEAYREGNIIDLGFTQLQVVDACSGLRYLIPLLILGILLAHVSRLRFWSGLLLAASTIPVTVATNSLRIALTGLLYPILGQQAAEGFFHDFSGWLLFMASLALLLGEIWLLRKVPAASRARAVDAAPPPAAGHQSAGAPAIAVQCSVLVLLLGCLAVSRSLQFRDQAPLARPLVQFPLNLTEWQGTRSALDQRYLDTLKLTDYLLADYTNGGGQQVSLYVAYQDSQRKGASTHSPGSCLPGSGWVFEESGQAALSERVRVNRAVMHRTGERMLVYYWFPQRGRVLTSMLQLKLFLFWDAVARRRTDGGMVRVITPVYASEGRDKAELRLASFTRQILPLLQKFIPN